MKKIVIAVLALFSLGIAEAQIKITETHKKSETVCSGAFGWNTLDRIEVEGTYYYFLTLTSDNRFDKSYSILLGEKKDALTSLNIFADNFSPDNSFTCKDANGNPFRLHAQNLMGEKRYAVKMDGYAGYAYLRLMDIRKFIRALTE